VDIAYFRTIPIGRETPRINLSEETKLKADNNTAEEYFTSHVQKNIDPHFITEIFFLNSFAHSLGSGPAMLTHSRLPGDITEMQRQVDRIQNTENWRNSPHAALFSAALERTKVQIEEAAALEATMDAVLWDRVAQEISLEFLGFVANWLLRVADPAHVHPMTMISLPLPEDVPIEWRTLPQFLFEIITDHLLYVMRFQKPSYLP
jgi:ubiquitin conjugation factor E4 B